MQETTQLQQANIVVPNTFREVLRHSSGSAAGYSAVSNWLTCPEKARLQARGVRRIPNWDEFDSEELSNLSFGTLCHFLRSLRVLYGHDAVEQALAMWAAEIPATSWLKAQLLFRIYESMYPRAQESWRYLGTEVEVITNIAPALGLTGPIFRTVRYDTIVVLPGVGGAPDELFSFEAKTMSRSGRGALAPYIPQAMVQVAVWNTNPHLVKQFGPMRGVLWDCLIKTTVPNVERVGPDYFGRVHTKLALQYLASPEGEAGGVVYKRDENGHYPRMLHACWGRWDPCQYINLCHEGSIGDFEMRDGSPYEGD